jgi:hypothetical protein
MKPAENPLRVGPPFLAERSGSIGETQMKSDPDDEPGIYLVYALVMFVAIIAATVIAAGVIVRVSL